MGSLEKIAANLTLIKQKQPLVHHITNYVTVNDCANITLAIGASPVMADDIAEVEAMVEFASALVLNLGTLNARTIDSMLAAGKKAVGKGLPVVLDPVGIGATRLRTAVAEQIVREVRPTVIRGNMSEMKFLAGLNVAIKGVDSVADEQDGEAIAKTLAQKLDCVIAITGRQDIITDGKNTILVNNGHAMLSQVTGTGCMTTSLVASYCAAGQDWLVGTAAGIATMGLAGETAQKSLSETEGIGTFRARLFDAVYRLTPEILLKQGRIADV